MNPTSSTAQRIFVVAAVSRPLLGGAVSTLESWTEYLASIGREVFVYTMTVDGGRAEPYKLNGVVGFRSHHFREWFHSSVMRLDLIGKEVITHADVFRPNLIVATDLYSAQIGSILRGHLQVPYVLTYHETPVPPHKIIGRIPRSPDVELAWSRHIFGGASYDLLLAQSKYYLDWARACGAPENKSRLHYFGIDTAQFRPHVPIPPEIKRYVGNKKYVLCSCRIVPRKRLEDLIAAIPTVIEKQPELLFLFTWYTDDATPEYVDGLLRKIEVRQILETVVRLPPIPHKLMPALYAHAVTTVLPSCIEGLGLSLLESQACGTPVIGTNVPGIRETINGGGLLVPKGDVNALAAAILCLAEDSALRSKLAALARSSMELRFSKVESTRALLTLFDSLTRRGRFNAP